jgi:hypothetical protein
MAGSSGSALNGVLPFSFARFIVAPWSFVAGAHLFAVICSALQSVNNGLEKFYFSHSSPF